MSRLFTYGCSFTQYEWSTWADIVGSTFDEHINYGKTGAGNHYIFNHVMQSIAKQEISKQDTVIICWSGLDREDRFYKEKWLTGGTIHNNKYYDKIFIEKYFDIQGAYLRDLAYITACYEVLSNTEANIIFISMMDLKPDSSEPFAEKLFTMLPFVKPSTTKKYEKMYKRYTSIIRPSFHNILFNYNWYSRTSDIKFVGYNASFLERYEQVSGDDWPSVDDLKNEKWDKFDVVVQQDIAEIFGHDSFDIFKLNKQWRSYDFHPTPAMHLEYVTKVLPEFKINIKTIEKIKNENSTLS